MLDCHTYGAAISRRQYLRVTLASGIGSVLECELR